LPCPAIDAATRALAAFRALANIRGIQARRNEQRISAFSFASAVMAPAYLASIWLTFFSVFRPIDFGPQQQISEQRLEVMGIAVSIFLIAVGAIMKFAVTATVGGIKIATVGVILMLVGVLGLVISSIMFGMERNRVHGVVAVDGPTTVVHEEIR
jgi:amino acid transporter